MPELNLGDDLTNPFLLNPEGTVTPEMEKQSGDGFSVAAKSEINGYGAPFIMAGANTRVCAAPLPYWRKCKNPMARISFIKNLPFTRHDGAR